MSIVFKSVQTLKVTVHSSLKNTWSKHSICHLFSFFVVFVCDWIWNGKHLLLKSHTWWHIWHESLTSHLHITWICFVKKKNWLPPQSVQIYCDWILWAIWKKYWLFYRNNSGIICNFTSGYLLNLLLSASDKTLWVSFKRFNLTNTNPVLSFSTKVFHDYQFLNIYIQS